MANGNIIYAIGNITLLKWLSIIIFFANAWFAFNFSLPSNILFCHLPWGKNNKAKMIKLRHPYNIMKIKQLIPTKVPRQLKKIGSLPPLLPALHYTVHQHFISEIYP